MARAKQAKSEGAGTPDAITLLKADHRQVEDWFGQFEKARDANKKQALATQIMNTSNDGTRCAPLDSVTTVLRIPRGPVMRSASSVS